MHWELLPILLCLAGLSGISISLRTRRGIHSTVNEKTESANKTGPGGIIGDGPRRDSRAFGFESGLSDGFGFGFLTNSGGNSGQPGGDPGTITSEPDYKYLVVQVDLVFPNATNISTLTEPLLREVKEILENGFPKESFRLTWLT